MILEDDAGFLPLEEAVLCWIASRERQGAVIVLSNLFWLSPAIYYAYHREFRDRRGELLLRVKLLLRKPVPSKEKKNPSRGRGGCLWMRERNMNFVFPFFSSHKKCPFRTLAAKRNDSLLCP